MMACSLPRCLAIAFSFCLTDFFGVGGQFDGDLALILAFQGKDGGVSMHTSMRIARHAMAHCLAFLQKLRSVAKFGDGPLIASLILPGPVPAFLFPAQFDSGSIPTCFIFPACIQNPRRATAMPFEFNFTRPFNFSKEYEWPNPLPIRSQPQNMN